MVEYFRNKLSYGRERYSLNLGHDSGVSEKRKNPKYNEVALCFGVAGQMFKASAYFFALVSSALFRSI